MGFRKKNSFPWPNENSSNSKKYFFKTKKKTSKINMVMGWGKRDTVRKREERDMTGFFFQKAGKFWMKWRLLFFRDWHFESGLKRRWKHGRPLAKDSLQIKRLLKVFWYQHFCLQTVLSLNFYIFINIFI